MEIKEIEFRKDMEIALLEQEKRINKELRVELELQTNRLSGLIDKQNGLYSNQIAQLTKEVAKLDVIVSSLKGRILGVGAACTALGGAVGYIIGKV